MAYFLSHWRGKLPLGITLWVNTIGLLVVLSYVELSALTHLDVAPSTRVNVTLASLFATRIVIFVWQITGLLRAIELDFLSYGSTLKTRALQIVSLLFIAFTAVYALDVIQGVLFYKNQLEVYARPTAQPGYTLSIDNSARQLVIQGDLEVGITRSVRSIIEENPTLKSVRLQSHGGQIYEGRGLAKLFTKNELDTYVYAECSSACATAFIGGKNRHISSNAKLGFHQYRVDTSEHNRVVPYYDLRKEQNRDLALFKSRGIQQLFLDRMFDQPANRIWYPDQQILLDTQLVHIITADKGVSK